jgi:hypothetical protein
MMALRWFGRIVGPAKLENRNYARRRTRPGTRSPGLDWPIAMSRERGTLIFYTRLSRIVRARLLGPSLAAQ